MSQVPLRWLNSLFVESLCIYRPILFQGTSSDEAITPDFGLVLENCENRLNKTCGFSKPSEKKIAPISTYPHPTNLYLIISILDNFLLAFAVFLHTMLQAYELYLWHNLTLFRVLLWGVSITNGLHCLVYKRVNSSIWPLLFMSFLLRYSGRESPGCTHITEITGWLDTFQELEE